MNKKRVGFFVLVLGLLISTIGWTMPNTVNTETVLATPVSGTVTAQHPTYVLRLKSNPTTGYSWLLVSSPKALVKVKHKYIPPSTNRIGAGGVDMWQFTATEAALAVPTVIKIQMTYARPWEANDQSNIQTFYITTH